MIFVTLSLEGIVTYVQYLRQEDLSFFHLYYLPLIIAAFFFRYLGALSVSFVSLLLFFLVRYHYGHEFINVELDTQRMLMLVLIGTVTAYLATDREVHRNLSNTDELTGLANYRNFQEKIHYEFYRSVRYHRPLSLIMADIDNFKDFNDKYGHLEGNHLLRQLGSILLANTRTTDIVSRYGGEELAILLPETKKAEAYDLAVRIRKTVEIFKFRGVEHSQMLNFTISLGVFSFPPASSPEDLIKKADEALYEAKRRGRNRVV